MFESCCLPHRIQSTAAHVSASLQTDGKVESGQENPSETREVWGARNRCPQTVLSVLNSYISISQLPFFHP